MSRLSSDSELPPHDIEHAISKQEESENQVFDDAGDNVQKEFEPDVPHPQSSTTNGLHRSVTAQDWNGPDDPENPENWPLWQRVYHTYVLRLICLYYRVLIGFSTPEHRSLKFRALILSITLTLNTHSELYPAYSALLSHSALQYILLGIQK